MTDTSADVRFTIVADAKIDQVQALANSFQTLQERVDALNGKLGAMGNAGQQAAQATTALTQAKATTTKATEQLATALGKGNEGLKTFIQHTGLATGGTGQFGQALGVLGGSMGGVTAGLAALATTVASVTVGLAEAGKAAQQNRLLLQSLMEVSGQGAGFNSVMQQLKGLRTEAALVGATMDDLVKGFRAEFAESGGDVAQVMEQIKVSLKVAAITGQEFGASFDTIGRALDGNLRALRQYGIYLSENQQTALKSMGDNERFAAVMRILNEQYKDGAEKTDSYARSQKELNAKLGEMRNLLTPEALNVMTAWNKGLLGMATGANQAAQDVKTLAGALGTLGSNLSGAGNNPVLAALLGAMIPGGAGTLGALGEALKPENLWKTALGPAGQLPGALNWAANQAKGMAPPVGINTPGLEMPGGSASGAPLSTQEAYKQYLERAGALQTTTIPTLVTEAKKSITAFYDAQIEDAKRWHDVQVENVNATEKAQLRGLEERQRAGQRALQAESQAENDRYQEQVRLIGLREEAELKAVDSRRTAEDQRHTQALKQIEKERDADIKSIEERRDKNLTAIDQQRDAENERFTQLGRQRQDEDRQQSRAFQQRQTDVRNGAQEEIEKERERSSAVVTHLKDEKEQLAEKHKADLAGIQQALDEAKSAHDIRLKQIATERDARLNEIATERDARLSAIDDEIRAMDRERQAAQYARQSQEASQGYADANKKLVDARKAGATPEEIARLEREVNQAREREAEVFTQHQYALRKQALEQEKDTIRTSAEAQQEAVRQSADAQKQAADDELKAVEDAERQKRDSLNTTYEAKSKLLDKQVSDEQEASRKEIDAINKRRDEALAAIAAEQTKWEDWRTERDRKDQDDHKAILGRIQEARENTAKQYSAWIDDIRATAQEKTEKENAAHTNTLTNLTAETAAIRDRYSSEKEGGERFEARKTHDQVMGDLGKRRTQFDDDMRNEREQIQGNAQLARDEIDKTWGDKPGGAQHQYKLMKQARLDAIDQLKKDSDDAKGSADQLLETYGKIADKLREIQGLGLKPGGAGGMPGGDTFVSNRTGGGGALQRTPDGSGIYVNKGPTMTPAQIEEAVRGTPLEGHGQEIYDLGVQYNVDPAFAISVARTESDFGRAANSPVSQTYNYGSISYYGGAGQLPTPASVGNPRFASYPTPVAGIEAVYRLIANQYYPNGQTDTASIYNGVNGQNAYAPVWDNNANALPNLNRQYQQYAGSGAPASGGGAGNARGFRSINQYDYSDRLKMTSYEAGSICGPVAALSLLQAYGEGNIPVEAVLQYSSTATLPNGVPLWNNERGMAGLTAEQQVLSHYGVSSDRLEGGSAQNWAAAQQAATSGRGVIISIGGAQGHYMLATDYDPEKGYYVGGSGMAMRNGTEWMKQEEIERRASQPGLSMQGFLIPTGYTPRPGSTKVGGMSRAIDYTDPSAPPELPPPPPPPGGLMPPGPNGEQPGQMQVVDTPAGPIALPFGYTYKAPADWNLSAAEQADPALKAALKAWNAVIEQATQAEARHRSAVLQGEASILDQQRHITEMQTSGKASAEELEAAQKRLEATQNDLAETNRRYGLSMAAYKEQLDGITTDTARYRAELVNTGKQLGILATSANAAMMGLGPTGPMGPQISSKPFGTWDQIKAFNDKFGPRVGNPFDMLPGENPLQWQEQALLSALGLNYYGMKFGDNENASSAIAKINHELTHQSGTAFGGGIANDPMGASDPGIKVAGEAGRGAVVNKPGLWKIAENPGDVEVIFNLSNPGTWWNVIAQTAAMGGAGRLAPLAEAITAATAGTALPEGGTSDFTPQFGANVVGSLPGAGLNYSALATRPLLGTAGLPRLGPLPNVPSTTVNVAMAAPALPPIAVPVTVNVSQGPGGQITASATAQAAWAGGGGGSVTTASFGGAVGSGGSYGAAPLTGALRGAGGIDPQAASLLGGVGNWQPFDRGAVGDLRN